MHDAVTIMINWHRSQAQNKDHTKVASNTLRKQLKELEATYQTRSLHRAHHPHAELQSRCRCLGHQKNNGILA